jgi:hypothetical protein
MAEKDLSLPVTPFMDGLDDFNARMKLQHGFICGVALPLWKALAACFPSLDFCVVQLTENSEYYAKSIK